VLNRVNVLMQGFGSLYAWEDARGCGALLDLDPNTIIDVWDQGAAGQWHAGVQDTVARGFQIVVSSGCYFLEYPPPWAKVWGWKENYACDIQVRVYYTHYYYYRSDLLRFSMAFSDRVLIVLGLLWCLTGTSNHQNRLKDFVFV
jgi:hypothetical protein